MKRIFAILMIAVLAISLVSCGGSFDTIRRGFENNGYTYYFPVGEEEIITTISRELDGLGIKYNVHYFKKTLSADMGVETLSIAAVIELEKASDVETIFNDARGNTLISLIEDYKTSNHIRKNSILISITKSTDSDLVNAFNG